MEYTTAQLKAGLSNAKAEYKISKSIQAQYPSDENLHHCKTTYARIERIKALIEAGEKR
jgi:hypothetical protein